MNQLFPFSILHLPHAPRADDAGTGDHHMPRAPRADEVGSSASIDWECEAHVEFDSDDCSANDSRDTAPLIAVHSKPTCDFDSLVLQPELSFLDDIIVEHFLDMRVFIRRNIPKDFVRSWNSIIVPLMSSIHSDHGMARPDLLDEQRLPTPSTCNARKLKLLCMLPRLIWHIPCRRINDQCAMRAYV